MSNNGRYSQIYTKIWNDEKFRQLSPEAQRFYFYVLTSPHSNMAGYYLLPKTYIERDMVTLPKGLDKPFTELLDKGFIRYDEESSVILIPNYFRYNSLDNKNQRKGANNRAKELPDNTLVKDFKEICKKYYPDGYETLTEGLVEGSGNTENRKQKSESRKQKTENEDNSEEPSPSYKEIIDYLNEKADRSYKSSTDKTRTKIKARFDEGFDLSDFKNVIDTKVAEWLDDSEMDQFIRPQTLFGTKFEGYLNQSMPDDAEDKRETATSGKNLSRNNYEITDKFKKNHPEDYPDFNEEDNNEV